MLDNLLISMRCIAPILIYMLVGVFVNRSHILPEESYPKINRFIFAFLFPQHLFNTVYNADFAHSFSVPRILFCAGVVSLFFFGSLFVLHRGKFTRREIGTLSQNAYRSNLNIVSLSLAEQLMGAEGLASMGIIAALITPLYNFYAVVTLEMHKEGGGKIRFGKVLLEILKNPLVIATALGFLLRLLPFRLPEVLMSSVATMGRTGTTLALIMLGASLRFDRILRDRKRIVWGNIYRLIAAPLMAFALAYLAGLRGSDLALVVLATGAPLATTTYTMCQVYDSDADLAAELIATTSAFCCLSLFVWIFLMKQLGIV